LKRLLACCLCAFAFQATAAAHVLDEYVEAAQISLAPEGARVELRLVPGVEVADRVFALIDLMATGRFRRRKSRLMRGACCRTSRSKWTDGARRSR
jgi:hypothetical protein